MDPAPTTATPPPPAPRSRAALAAAVVVALALGASTLHRAGLGSPKERTDLPVYLAASTRLLDGRDPIGATSSRGWPYYYPPTLAALLTPLARAPLPVAAAVWFVVGAAAFGAGALAARRAAVAAPWDRWDALALALVAVPTSSALLRGQLGPVLLGLCGGALSLLARRRDAPAGALLALAAALKVTPGLLLLALPLERRWRATAAGAAALVVWLVLVPAPFLGVGGALRSCAGAAGVVVGLAAAPARVQVGGDAPPRDPHIGTNQSIASQVIRRLPEGPGRAAAVWLLGGLTLAASLPLCARASTFVPGLALLLAAPLIAAPVAWHHHHVVLLPALWLLADDARAEARPARAALGAFAALSALHFAVTPLRPFGLLGWGTLAVFVALAARAWRSRRGGPTR